MTTLIKRQMIQLYKKRTSTSNTKDKTKVKTGKFGSIKTTIDGIIFDSKMESQYYTHLKELKAKGEIKDFTLQPEYMLLESFKKDGRTIRAIKYISDFLEIHNDGSEVIVDVKGRETEAFKIKRKLFDARYPDKTLKLVIFKNEKEGWVDFDENKKKVAQAKRAAKKK
jgi:hypothetical protein